MQNIKQFMHTTADNFAAGAILLLTLSITDKLFSAFNIFISPGDMIAVSVGLYVFSIIVWILTGEEQFE